MNHFYIETIYQVRRDDDGEPLGVYPTEKQAKERVRDLERILVEESVIQ